MIPEDYEFTAGMMICAARILECRPLRVEDETEVCASTTDERGNVKFGFVLSRFCFS